MDYCYAAQSGCNGFISSDRGSQTNCSDSTTYNNDQYNEYTKLSTIPGLLERTSNDTVDNSSSSFVQFEGDYTGIIQAKGEIKLPLASDGSKYALWQVKDGDGTVYQEGDTISITGNTTIICTKYDKGSATANGTERYDGNAKNAELTWDKIQNIASDASVVVPDDVQLTYQTADGDDWGDAVAPGTYNVAITTEGNYYYKTQNQNKINGTLTIEKADSSVALSFEPVKEGVVQREVKITAVVTGAASGEKPSGTVTFYVDDEQLGDPVTMDNGSAVCSWTPAVKDEYTIKAVYSGDTYYNGSSKDGESYQVNKGTLTAENFTVSGNEDAVTYDAQSHGVLVTTAPGIDLTLAEGTAAITVKYKNDSTNEIATELPVNVGTYSILVDVEESDNYNAAVELDTGKDLVIQPAQPNMVVASSATEETTYGDAVTLTATLSGVEDGDVPTGTVTFKNGEETLGEASVESGIATLTLTGDTRLGAGRYDNVTATYKAAEGSNYTDIGQAQSCQEFTVQQKNIQGAEIVLGTVDAYDGTEKTVSIISVVVDELTLTLTNDYTVQDNSNHGTNAGAQKLTIQGVGNYTGTASESWNIAQATLTDENATTFFEENTPSVHYNGAAFSGTAYTVKNTFESELNGDSLTVHYRTSGGEWSADVPANGGTYDIGVTVSQTSNFAAIQQPVKVGTLTINPVAPTVTIVSDKDSDTASYEDEVTFTVTVDKVANNATVPTGTVSLSGLTGVTGGADLPLDGEGKATFTTDDLTVDTHKITATYTPAESETNYKTAESSELSFQVGKKSMTFQVSNTEHTYETGVERNVIVTPDSTKLQANDFTVTYYKVDEDFNQLNVTPVNKAITVGKYLYVINFKEEESKDSYTIDREFAVSNTTVPNPEEYDNIGFMYINAGIQGMQNPIYFATSEVTRYVTDGGYDGETVNPLTNSNGTVATYTSSNTKVATVDEKTGDVTIIGEGVTTIQATSAKSETTPVYASYTLKVIKKPITVTAQNKTITYGEELDYTADDVIVSDGVELSALTGNLDFTTRYEVGFNVDTYEVTPCGLTSDLYDITFIPGMLTVNEKKLTAQDFTVYAGNKIYDGSKSAVVSATVKQESLVDGDVITAMAEGSFTDVGAGDNREVTWTITGLTGAKASNYVLDQASGTTTANISKAAVNIYCSANTIRTYTGNAQSVDLSAMVGSLPFDSNRYTVYYTNDSDEKTTEPKAVGTYTVSVELNYEEDKQNYSINPFEAKLTIQTASQDLFYISGVPTAVYYGDEFTLSTDGANGTVTWSVDEGDPATIDNGTVKITGTGSITVTATSTRDGYEDRTATTTFTAEKRVLSISGEATDKTYDGNTTIHVDYTLADVKGGFEVPDTITVQEDGAPHTSDAAAGSDKVVYINGLSLRGEGAEYFTLQTSNITTTVNIEKKEINSFTFTASSKYYDGTQAATVGSIMIADVISGDENDVALVGSAKFDSADAAENAAVTYTATGLSGSKAGNYELKSMSAVTTADILAMPITFTVGALSYTFDGAPKTVVVTAVDQTGALFTDFTLLYNGEPTAPSDAGEYSLTVKLNDNITASNYDISNFPADLEMKIAQVTQEQMSIVGLPGSAQYGDSFTLTMIGGSGDGKITWSSSNEDVSVVADKEDESQATVQINGGIGETVTIMATKAADNNHEEKTATVMFIPVEKSVQFTLSNSTVVYDGTPKKITVAPSVEDATYTITYNGDETEPTDAGTYNVVVNGTGNYTGTAYCLLTIQKATLSDLEVSLESWTYDGGTETHTPSYSGDKPEEVAVTYSYSTLDQKQPKNAGRYIVYATFTGDNYETLTVQSEFVISKATLKAKADDATREYGQANPTFTISYSGFMGDEDENVLWQQPLATCTAIPTSPSGEYTIILSGGSAENYNIVVENGTLHVTTYNSGTLSITGGSTEAKVGDSFTVSANYSGQPVDVTWSVDESGVLSITPDGKVTALKEGEGTIMASLEGDDRFGSTTTSMNVLVTKTEIILTASDQNVTYNGSEQFITLISSMPDFTVNDDSVTVTYKQDDTDVSPVNAGTYTAEYTINDDKYSGTGSFTFTIEPKEATITIGNLEQVYDGEEKTVSVTTTDDVAYSVTYNDVDTAPTEAGTYSVVVEITDPNYTGRGTATMTIAGGTIDTDSIIIEMKDRTYGDKATPAQVSGNPIGTTVSVTYSGRNLVEEQEAVPTDAGEYTVKVTISGDNYETATKTASFTIEKALLTAYVGPYFRPFGHNNPDFIVNYSGYKYDDDASVVITPVSATTSANEESTPGEYEITLSGGYAFNYDFIYQDGTLTVTQDTSGTLLINGLMPTLVVGGTLQLSASYLGNVVDVTWESTNSDVATITEQGVVQALTEGETTIKATMNSEEYGEKEVFFNLQVKKESVTLHLDSNRLVYNGMDQPVRLIGDSVTISDSELVVSYVLDDDPDQVITVPRNVGKYTVSWNIESESYTGSGSATLYIVKADVNVRAADVQKVYGDENPAYTVTGLLGDDATNPEYIEKINQMFSFSSDADATGIKTPVGQYAINMTLKDDHDLEEDPNYNFIISSETGILTVNARQATITPKAQTITYGQDIAQDIDQVDVSGLAEGCQLSNITLTADSTDAGSSTITASDAQIMWDGEDVTENYAINYNPGSLEIKALPVTVTPGKGKPTYLAVTFSEEVPELTTDNFAVTVDNEPVELSGVIVSADKKSYTLQGSFEVGKTYVVTVTLPGSNYALSGSPMEFLVSEEVFYQITVQENDHGTVTADLEQAEAGDPVHLTVEPAEGYSLSAITILLDGGTDTPTKLSETEYVFTMPASDVTIRSTFRKPAASCDGGETCPSYDYEDVDQDAWYHESVDYVINNGYMIGISTEPMLFGTEENLTRAQAIQTLYQIEGSPEYSKIADYSDVSSDQWFADAVNWGTEHGIIQGRDNGEFDPDSMITREDLITIIYRYVKVYKGLSVETESGIPDSFEDRDSVCSYAVDAMAWAIDRGIINGMTATTLEPQRLTRRCEVAKIIATLCTAYPQIP